MYKGTPANKVVVELNPDRLWNQVLNFGMKEHLFQMMRWVCRNPGNQSHYAICALSVAPLPSAKCVACLGRCSQQTSIDMAGPLWHACDMSVSWQCFVLGYC